MQRTSWSLIAGMAAALSISMVPIGAPSVGATPAPTPAPTTTTTAPNADVIAFGDAAGVGSTGVLNQPIVGLAASPSGNGYWVVARDGGIFAFGDAHYFGSTGAITLNQPIVGMTPTPDGGGYWFVAADGGIFAFGNAAFKGSTGSMRLNQPIVGMAATPSGQGYWLVARDGGIFAFGDAVFYGSTGNVRLNKPIVGMAAQPDGHGYWFVAADGGIFAFGTAGFHGSTADLPITSSIVGMASTPDGQGYWLATGQGAVYNFGDAINGGSVVGATSQPVVGIAASPTGHGYWLATSAPTAVQYTNQGTGPAIGPSPLARNVRILYTDNASGLVFTANTDGGFRRTISTHLVPDSVAVSPDGTKVVGEADTGNGQLAIGLQGSDGSNPVLLTQPSSSYIDTWPAFSHNGQRIAWIRTVASAGTARAHATAVDQATSGLWIMNADGSGQSLVPNTFDATGPISWSPDGSRVGFTACSPSSQGCTTSVVAISTDGSKRQTLVAGMDPADPVWSPDGTEVLYDQGGSIFQIHPDGTGLTKLIDASAVTPANSTVDLVPVAFYPDGSQIILDAHETDTNGMILDEILVGSKDGLTVRRFPVRTESSALGVTG